MRISKSQHRVRLRAGPREVWQKPLTFAFRPWLHLQNLAHLLDGAVLDDEALPIPGRGKKRALPPRAASSQAKRARSAEISSTNTPAMANDWPENDYPFLPQPSCDVISDPGETHTAPVWQHTFNLEYYKDAGNVVNAALDASYWREEELFGSKLKLLFGEIEEPISVDLGAVDFFEYNNRLVATLASITQEIPENEDLRRSNWLCLLPDVTDGNDNDAYDFSSKLVEDLLLACHFLRLLRRVTIEGRLKLIVLPCDWSQEVPEDLPFQLVIQVNISFVLPFIFQPCPPRTPKRKASLVEQSKRRLLHHLYFPSSTSGSDTVTNIPFFYSCLKPAPLPPSKRIENAAQPKQLVPKLLPFQRRSVAWLLSREGLAVPSAGKIVPSTTFNEFTFWDQIQEGNYTWYYNRLSDEIASEIDVQPPVLGAILAEEPGLGKTLETIALILLHSAPPERNPTVKRWDPEARLEVHAIKSTLIVTPPALQQQWIDEIKTHAPSLKVLVYEGWSKVIPKPKKPRKKATKKVNPRAASRHASALIDEATPVPVDDLEAREQSFDWPTEANKYDVVITTYQVLKTDFNVARAARLRPRRENVVYLNSEYRNNSPRSPLVRVEWFRVVMDEVQMVGGGRTEDMVSLIPRLSSLAVSGTPARAQVADLIRVLRFLRVNTVIGSSRMWSRLLKKSYADHFTAFMQNYAIRTLKASVKNELTIPQQTRFLVPIELGMVERHVYDHAFEAVLLEIGLDARGVAAFEGWEVDAHALRNAIRRLRGICTHPQVGQLQRPNDKLIKPGTVKTIAEVLQTMRETNRRNIMEDWRSKVLLLTRHAQLQQNVGTDRNRYQTALGVLQQAEKQVNELIDEIKADLVELQKKGNALKEEAAARREAMGQKSDDASISNKDKGKSKQRAVSEPLSVDEDEGSEDGSLPRNPAGEEHATNRGALQHRLREAKLALHKVKFLQGDVYHMLGEAFSSAEATAYEAAEITRRDLLSASEVDAARAVTQLGEQTSEEHVSEDELLVEIPLLGKGGIRSHDLMEECDDIADVLNGQSKLMWQWRTHITQLLTQPLNNGQNEADGQEYQRNLDNQGEAETYMKAYADLLADRREALSSERSLLAEHEVRERKQRMTKAAKKAQLANDWQADEEMEGMEVDEMFAEEEQPEHQVLLKELSDQRKELLNMLNGRAVKSILVDLQAVKGRIVKDSDVEKAIVTDAIATLRKFMKDQNTLMTRFENDLALIRKAFNQRLLYFRQLQEISDSVVAASWEGSVDTALEQCLADRAALDARMNTNRARYRYMLHLAKNRSQGVVDEDEETCILCRCDFIRGFVTPCAHVFCEGCLKAWMIKKEGKTCPVCRVPLDPDAIQHFTINESEDLPPRLKNGEPAPRSKRRIEYNVIDPLLFQEIQAMESFGDYGSKIQTLVRHLLYLQSTEPGAKSIVFSAWSDSLYIVQHALQGNGINCLRIDQKSKGQSAANKFKSDPTLGVLLLHGEKENAGLNVTCASRVFLLESVVHHSFEIQAIARIDRMGQTRSTEVYCYYAEETVERNILDLAARQDLSLYTRDRSEGTLDLTSFTNLNAEKPKVDAPGKKKVKDKAQKGDFIFKVDDMLAVLFPHMYEDVEYLLPDEVEEGEPVASGSGSRG